MPHPLSHAYVVRVGPRSAFIVGVNKNRISINHHHQGKSTTPSRQPRSDGGRSHLPYPTSRVRQRTPTSALYPSVLNLPRYGAVLSAGPAITSGSSDSPPHDTVEVPGTQNRLLKIEASVFNVSQKTDAPIRKCRAPFTLVSRDFC